MNYSIKSNGQTIGTFGTFLEALAQVERLVHEHAAKTGWVLYGRYRILKGE